MKSFTPIDHQFSLFEYNEMRPKRKVPISAERIREAKALLKAGDRDGCARKIREVREQLEEYEKRITNNEPNQRIRH